MAVLSYDEFRRRREGGESYEQVTKPSTQYQQTANSSGTLTYEQFHQARQSGQSLDTILATTTRGQHASQKTAPPAQAAPQRASAAPVIPEAEQRRQSQREEISSRRSTAKATLDTLEAERMQYAGYMTDGSSYDQYAQILADLDNRIASARQEYKAADQEYKDVYAGYNAARREVKEAKRNLRDVESQYAGWATDDLSAQNIGQAMNNAEDVKAARTRLANAREAYTEQGGNPDANIIGSNAKSWAGQMLGTARYMQELNQPGNEIKIGFLTVGGGDDRMPAEMRAAIAQKQKEEYEAKHGSGSWVPTYQRTQDMAARLQRESAEEINSMKAGRSELGQFGIDVAGQGVQMGLDAATGKILPGGSLTAMALRTFGSSAQEAKDAGATLAQQGLYGAGTAAVEVLTEKMFGLTHIYGANMTDSLVSHAIGKFTSNRLGQAALGMVADALGEGLEEVISDIANPILKTIYNDKTIRESFRDNWDWSEVLYDFAVGAAMGFVGGSVEGVTEATGLSAPDAQSEFFMKAGENGMSFGEAIRDWKSLQQVSGASVEAQTDAAFDVLTGKESLEQQQERQSNALQRLGLTEEEAKNYIDTGRIDNPLTVSTRDRGAVTLGGEEVKIVSAKGEDVTVEQNGEKKTVKLDELEGMSEGYKKLVQAAAESEYGEAVLRLYNPGQDVDAYTKAWNYAEDVFGAQTNISLEKARENPLLKDLTDGQLKFALELGRQRYDASKATAAQRAAQFKAARQEALKAGAFARKKGTVNTKGGTFGGRTVKGVDVKRLSTPQKKLFAMTQALADAVNINFVVYDGEANEGGSYIKGGTVMVNINSGTLSGKTLGAATLSHELTHHLQDYAPEQYQELKDFIVAEILKQSPEQFNRMVQRQLALEPNLSYDQATDEMIANACQTMLLNSKAVEKLARQNMTLAERITDWISETAEKIKAAFEDVDLDDNISIYEPARAIAGVMDEVQELWDKALLAANENYNAEQATGKKNTAENGGTQNMYFGEQAREADKTALETARSMEKNGTDAETIRKETGWFRGMDGKWRFEIDDSRIKWESAGDIQFREDHPEYDEYRNLLDKMCNSPELLAEDEQKRLVELDDMWSGELSRLSQRVKNGRVKLGTVLRHESLFRNYPELKDVYIEFADLGTSNGQLVARSDGDSVIQINRNQRMDPRSTLIHEIQHAIQHIEGFSTGSSPDAWSRRLDSGYVERRRSAEFEAADQKYRDLFNNAPEQLKNKIRELNRAKLNSDLDLWDQIEAELYDGPYGKLFMEIDKADMERDRIRNQDRQIDAYELYRNTAGEIEARDVQYRQRYDAEKRRNTPPDLGDENTVFAEGAEKAQEIKKAVGNKPFVEIQDDILSGVAQKDWISTVWNTLQAKFPGAIRIGNSNILIDKQSRDELTRSKSTGYLARNNQQMYEDKLRSMYNADELLKATTDWINEKVNHARKDKIVDFARGHVLFRVGSNDYVGEVVVGNRANGEMILYDIVRIQPTTITAKEVDVRDARNPLPENSRLQTSASSMNSISDSYAKSNPKNLDEEQHQRWGIGETEAEQQERKESFDAIKAQNKILKARADYWRGQTRQTKENTVRQQDTDRMANELLRQYASRADKAEVKAALKELGDWLVRQNGESLSYDELYRRARSIAEDVIDGNYSLLDNSRQEDLNRLKDFLKGTTLNISSSDWRDTGDEGFRKKYGRYFTVSENGRSLDSAWGELSAMFGEGVFPEDVYAPGDMLNMIADYLDMWKPQYGNEFEQNRGEAVEWATGEIIDRMLSEEVRQTPATYADKAQQKLNAQIARDRERLDTLRAQKNARIEQIRRQAAEKNKQIRIAEKAAKYEATAKVKQHYMDMLQRQRNRRSDTNVRGKIKALHKELTDMLLKPKEGRYVPKNLVKATAEILGAIDTTSGRAVKAKAALAQIKVQYDALAQDPKYSLTYDETVSSLLQTLVSNIGDGSIYDLTGTELENVYNVMCSLRKTIKDANRLVGSEIEATAYEAANQMMREIENAKGIPTKALRKFVMAQMTPSSFFRMMGGYVKNSMCEQMFGELNRGQLTQTQVLMEGGQIFRELIDDKKNLDTLHDQKNLVDIGLKDDLGNSIKITRGMMLSVYMHLQNEQNARHISYGGLTVPRLRQYYKNQMADAFNGKTGRAVAFATEIAELNRQLSEAETEQERTEIQDKIAELQEQTDAYMSNLRAQIEKQLTEYDRKWIAAAQKFFDEYSKNKLNEVTEMVYGFSKAQVDHYFPIHTDANYRAASFDTIVRDMSLENAGFMKERINGANPILLEDITDVISNQLRRTAQYVGLMPAIRNFNKAYGKARAGYSMSVQSAMSRTFENEGKKYIENLMADLNGARKTEANIFDELRGNMAGAVLTLNPRVTLAQAASFPSAAAEIGYTPLMKALTDMKNPMWDKGLQEEIAKWTPLWWYRMQGYSTAELGDIKNNEQFMAKVMDKMKWATGWIQAADGLTTGGLWQASKYYVDENFSDLQKGSDEYMMKVAEVYNRVLEKTQPDYTTMQRPDILRNPNAIVKQLTMFMTQRLQNMNILYDAAATYSHYVRDMDKGRNGVTAADVKQAKTRLIWAVSSQVAASATIVIFKALADALMHSVDAYRDDDDELTVESVSKTMLTNFAETITSNVLWGAEAFSWLKSALTGERYYGVSLNGVDTFTDMLSDGNKLIQKLIKGDLEGAGAPAWKLAKAVSQFFGAPLGNVEKFVKMIANNIEDAKNGDWGTFEAGVDRTKAQNTHLLFDALQAGDTARTDRLKENFKDEKDVRSSLKGYIKELYTGENQQILKDETIRLLQKYCGMTRRDAESTAQEWTMLVREGINYSDLNDEFIAGNVDRAHAIKYLQTYKSMTRAEAEAKVLEWQCEKDTGIAFGDIGTEVKTGRLGKAKALSMLMKYGGKSEEAADKQVEGWLIEHEYNIRPSELQEEYMAGNVSVEDAFDILGRYKYNGKEDAEEKAYNELVRWNFIEENPGTEDITVTQIQRYQNSGLEGVVDGKSFLDAYEATSIMQGVDTDGDGKANRYTRVDQQLAYIDGMDLTSEQKTSLALALGINEKSVRNRAPWNKRR